MYGRSVRLTQSTKSLVGSFSQLTQLIQRLCAEDLDSLSADYLQDTKGQWYFLNTGSYSYSQRKAMTARLPHPRTLPPHRTALTSYTLSPRYNVIVTPEPLSPSKATPKQSHSTKSSRGCLPSVENSKRRKELQVEGLVREVLGSRGVLKHTSYKRWLERTSTSTNYLPIDRLFALNISKKARSVHRSVKNEVENLKALVRTLRRQHDSNQIINTKFVMFEVGRYLLKLLMNHKNRLAADKPKPLNISVDFLALMSQKVLDGGNEMLAHVRTRIKKSSQEILEPSVSCP